MPPVTLFPMTLMLAQALTVRHTCNDHLIMFLTYAKHQQFKDEASL